VRDCALFRGGTPEPARETSYPLYLLIDEYDNFANELLMSDEASYRKLVPADGPFKRLMKWVKAATEGEGIERLFLTALGEEARRLDVPDRDEIACLPAVAAELEAATRQARFYRKGLIEGYGDVLRLRSFVVAAIGFKRLVAREVSD